MWRLGPRKFISICILKKQQLSRKFLDVESDDIERKREKNKYPDTYFENCAFAFEIKHKISSSSLFNAQHFACTANCEFTSSITAFFYYLIEFYMNKKVGANARESAVAFIFTPILYYLRVQFIFSFIDYFLDLAFILPNKIG